MLGEIKSLTPEVLAAPQKAVFGPASGDELVVYQADCPPLAEVLQPVGKAGGVTLSKFSAKPKPQP